MDKRIVEQYLVPQFSGQSVGTIDDEQILSWQMALSKTALKPSTRSRIVAVMRSILNFAISQGHRNAPNPCTLSGKTKIPVAQESKGLDPESARRLRTELEKADDLLAKALLLILLTGVQRSIILEAHWEDIDLQTGVFTGRKAGGAKTVSLRLSKAALGVVASLPHLDGCPWLFPTRNGERPISNIFSYWDKVRQKLDLGHIRIQDLSTFARRYGTIVID